MVSQRRRKQLQRRLNSDPTQGDAVPNMSQNLRKKRRKILIGILAMIAPSSGSLIDSPQSINFEELQFGPKVSDIYKEDTYIATERSRISARANDK
ncbi:hypothetical protein YC2023_115692 [Brassica napus]